MVVNHVVDLSTSMTCAMIRSSSCKFEVGEDARESPGATAAGQCLLEERGSWGWRGGSGI